MALSLKLPEPRSLSVRQQRLATPPRLDVDADDLKQLNEELTRIVESNEAGGKKARSDLETLATNVRDAELTDPDLDEIDKLVDHLGTDLRRLASELRQTDPHLQLAITRAKTLAAGDPAWQEFAQLLERHLDEMFAMQDALDRTRTGLLVRLSQAEKGHGPIFDDPELLREHLESILDS